MPCQPPPQSSTRSLGRACRGASRSARQRQPAGTAQQPPGSRQQSAHGQNGLTHASPELMTALQKHDLGYQAFVREKMGQRLGSSRGAGGGGAAPGTAAGRPPPPAASTARRPSTESPFPLGQASAPATSEVPGCSGASRVQFSQTQGAAPRHSVDSPLGAAASRSASPSPLLGQLSLPGMGNGPRGTSAARMGMVQLPQLGAAAGQGDGQGDGEGEGEEELCRAIGMAPHVKRALHASTSMKLAAAASTARTIHASMGAADAAALQSMRLYALHAEFATRFKQLRQSRAGMFFALPLLLLSMRLAAHTLFSTLFPLWTRLPEGLSVLQRMDEALVKLFDPHGYLQVGWRLVVAGWWLIGCDVCGLPLSGLCTCDTRPPPPRCTHAPDMAGIPCPALPGHPLAASAQPHPVDAVCDRGRDPLPAAPRRRAAALQRHEPAGAGHGAAQRLLRRCVVASSNEATGTIGTGVTHPWLWG